MHLGFSCHWCHIELSAESGPSHCPTCGHQVGVQPEDCECDQCRDGAARMERFLMETADVPKS